MFNKYSIAWLFVGIIVVTGFYIGWNIKHTTHHTIRVINVMVTDSDTAIIRAEIIQSDTNVEDIVEFEIKREITFGVFVPQLLINECWKSKYTSKSLNITTIGVWFKPNNWRPKIISIEPTKR